MYIRADRLRQLQSSGSIRRTSVHSVEAGVTVYANNSVHITDSVIEGFGMWGVNTQTILGSFGGTQLDNMYWEEGGGPCTHPYNPGGGTVFSAAGIIFQ